MFPTSPSPTFLTGACASSRLLSRQRPRTATRRWPPQTPARRSRSQMCSARQPPSSACTRRPRLGRAGVRTPAVTQQARLLSGHEPLCTIARWLGLRWSRPAAASTETFSARQTSCSVCTWPLSLDTERTPVVARQARPQSCYGQARLLACWPGLRCLRSETTAIRYAARQFKRGSIL